MFLEYLFSNPQFYIYWIVIIVFSTCIHEFSHALTAYLQGDNTAKEEGYFTINPVLQMGKVSLICLLLFGLCWGACPVSPNKFKYKYSDALVSFAGPLANIIIATIFALAGCFLAKYQDTSVLMNNILYFCYIGAYSNSVMGVFNLIPLPPLDGSKILEFICPQVKPAFAVMGMRGLIFLFLVLSIFPPLNEILWGSGIFFIKSIMFIYQFFSGLIHSIL